MYKKYKYALFLIFCGFLLQNCTSSSNGNNENNLDSPSPNSPSPDSSDSDSSDSTFVYFLGNSVTYVENIPKKLDTLLHKNNIYADTNHSYIESTKGGAVLQSYLEYVYNTTPYNFIAQALTHRPKYIVLQEQSDGPLRHNTKNYLAFIQSIASSIEAEIVFYQTWHVKEGNVAIDIRDFLLDPSNIKNIKEEYRDIAEELDLAMVPIGDIWHKIIENKPTLDLDPDNIHQNALGAAINASAFFYTLVPDFSYAPNILKETGISISESDDKYYNQIIFDTVREDIQAKLKGFKRNIKDKSIPDLVGDSILEAEALPEKTYQILDVHLSKYDVDIYKLPRTFQNKKITLNIFCDTPNYPRLEGAPTRACTGFFRALYAGWLISIFDSQGNLVPAEPTEETRGGWNDGVTHAIVIQPKEEVNYLVFVAKDNYREIYSRIRMEMKVVDADIQEREECPHILLNERIRFINNDTNLSNKVLNKFTVDSIDAQSPKIFILGQSKINNRDIFQIQADGLGADGKYHFKIFTDELTLATGKYHYVIEIQSPYYEENPLLYKQIAYSLRVEENYAPKIRNSPTSTIVLSKTTPSQSKILSLNTSDSNTGQTPISSITSQVDIDGLAVNLFSLEISGSQLNLLVANGATLLPNTYTIIIESQDQDNASLKDTVTITIQVPDNIKPYFDLTDNIIFGDPDNFYYKAYFTLDNDNNFQIYTFLPSSTIKAKEEDLGQTPQFSISEQKDKDGNHVNIFSLSVDPNESNIVFVKVNHPPTTLPEDNETLPYLLKIRVSDELDNSLFDEKNLCVLLMGSSVIIPNLDLCL